MCAVKGLQCPVYACEILPNLVLSKINVSCFSFCILMQNLSLVVNEVLQDHERLAVGKIFNKYFLRSVIMKKLSKGMLMTALICGSIVPVLCGGASVYAAETEDEALSAFA